MQKKTISVNGNIQHLGNNVVGIKASGILLLSFALDAPTFAIEANPGESEMRDDKVTMTPVTVNFSPSEANVAQIVVSKDSGKKDDTIYLYVVDTNIRDAKARLQIEAKLTLGAFDTTFDTGFVLADTDKIAAAGLKGQPMVDIMLDGDEACAVRKDEDGFRLITNKAAYFVTREVFKDWLAGNGVGKLEAVKKLDFDTKVTTLSRRAEEDVFYVSGPTKSYKIRWNGDAEILEVKAVRKKVVGPLIGDPTLIATGTTRITSDGIEVKLGFQDAKSNILGFRQSAAA